MKPYRERWIEDSTTDETIYHNKSCTYETMAKMLGRMNKLMPYMMDMEIGLTQGEYEVWCDIVCETQPEISGKLDEKQYSIKQYLNKPGEAHAEVFSAVDQNGHLFMSYAENKEEVCMYVDSDAIYTVSNDNAWRKEDRIKLSHYVKTYYQINFDPHNIESVSIRLNRLPACNRDYSITFRRNDDGQTWRIWVEVTRKYKTGEVNCYDEEELDESVPTDEELKAITDAELKEYKPLGGN